MKHHRLKTCLFLLGVLFFTACQQNSRYRRHVKSAPFLTRTSNNIDTLLENMSLEEKIGQLFFVTSDIWEEEELDTLASLIRAYSFGGLMLEEHYYPQDYNIIDSLKKIHRVPFLYGNRPNAGGLSNSSFGLHSLRADSMIYEFFERRLEASLGRIDFNFEVNLNGITSLESVYKDSVYNEQLTQVLINNRIAIQAYQNKGILTGLNDCSDYHISQDNYIPPTDSLLFPYRNMANEGISMMLLDTNTFTLDTLKTMKTNSIRYYFTDSISFGGLVMSDAFDNDGLQQQFKTGIDAFIVPFEKVNSAMQTMKQAIKKGIITEGMLNFSVKKVLMAKDWTARLKMPKDTTSEKSSIAWTELAQYEYKWLSYSTVIAKDDNNLLPFKDVTGKTLIILTTENDIDNDFHQPDDIIKEGNYYAETELLSLENGLIIPQKRALKASDINKYKRIIIRIDDQETNFEVLAKSLELLKDKDNVVLHYTGHPTYLKYFEEFKTIIYQDAWDDFFGESYTAALLFGAAENYGQLPYNVSEKLHFGQGKIIDKPIRIKKSEPEEVGVNSEKLEKIEAIVREGINEKAMPGCQVVVLKSGHEIYNKAFGHHTYNKQIEVEKNHVYDLASITKVVSTTMAMMKLYQRGKYSLSDPLHKILGRDSLSNIDEITIRSLLIHQSGLPASMPITKYLRNRNYYSSTEQKRAEVQVAHRMYLYNTLIDTLWREIKQLEIKPKQGYKYSDVNANILQRIVEKITKKELDQYVNDYYYEPLGMRQTLYNPRKTLKKAVIVPTEKDDNWRKQLVHGYVHDESAAILGGVAGNAGLFSTASDLAILSQMLLNGGSYGGKSYLQKETIQFFTASTHGNHRGLGFNKQRTSGTNSCATAAPLSTYGHTGFTGNCFWVDPENELVYIFLSNRVYPKRNGRLSKLKIRDRIHQVIYDAFQKEKAIE